MKNAPAIIKSNELIEARYKLSLNEQRLVLLLISIIKPGDEDFQDYELTVSNFVNTFELKNCKAMHSEIAQAARALLVRCLDFRNEKGDDESSCWLSYAKYQKGSGSMIVRFDKSLKPYLLQLKSHFTQYQLSTVVKFKSQYSIRLYELLKEYEYLGRGGPFYRVITMENLKGFFGVKKGEYKIIGNLKTRLLDPAVKEISLYSDLSITQVEYIKEGRSVGSVKFTAEPRAEKPPAADSPAGAAPKEKKPPEHIGVLLGFGIAEAVAKKWGVQYGQKKILAVCGYVRAKQEAGEVKDAPAYLSKALENDYHLAWQNEREQKAARQSADAERKARKEAEENRLRQEAIRKIAATLEAFHALPEGEQEALRDRFEAENRSILMKNWKKHRASEKQPENFSMFSGMFAAFVDGIQKTAEPA